MKQLLAIAAMTSAFGCGSAIAQSESERGNKDAVLELTMTLLPANAEAPDAVTAMIELPKADSSGVDLPSAQGVEHSERGLGTADVAGEDGRAFGKAAAAAAREDRENASRASHDVETQEQPPALPETPDPPGPPAR